MIGIKTAVITLIIKNGRKTILKLYDTLYILSFLYNIVSISKLKNNGIT